MFIQLPHEVTKNSRIVFGDQSRNNSVKGDGGDEPYVEKPLFSRWTILNCFYDGSRLFHYFAVTTSN